MKTHNMFGKDGAYAGRVCISGHESEMAIISVELSVCGKENFDFWMHQAMHFAEQLLDEQPKQEQPE